MTVQDVHDKRLSSTDPQQAAGGGWMPDHIWLDGRIAWAVASVAVIGFALVSAWIMPRGPITAIQALGSLGMALLVGLLAGLATGSRWAPVLAPATYAVVLELGWLGVEGPLVDLIRPQSLLGILAWVLGRGLIGLLVLVPMFAGGLYGVWWAARLGHLSATGPGRAMWVLTGALTVLIIVVAASLARPASTAPILGSSGEAVEGSVAELTSVTIGGHDQVLMIRGRSVDNPVLLYLTGGPGGTDLGAVRLDTGLEEHFVVVTWEQRGAGKSYAALEPTDTFTLDQFVSDTLEVTNYLRDRFDQEKVYLVGNSWGTTLGVLAAQQQPELYHAYVGTGQMVSQRATDVMFWEDAVAWAERSGDSGLAETLRDNGPPPYEDLSRYDPVVSSEHAWNAYPEFDSGNEMPAILFVPEYTWMDRLNAFRGFLDTTWFLYPQLQGIDFRADVPKLDIPVYMVSGEHEARGRRVPAEEWFEMLDAPHKEAVAFQGAGHRAHFDDPARFADVMAEVLSATP